MSIAAMGWAWSQKTESSGQRLVLLALADAAGGDEDDPRMCWPSVGRIAKMADQGESTVRKHMERLCETGLISKVERRRRRDGTLGTWIVTVNFTTAHPRALVDEATAHPGAVVHRSPMSAHEPPSTEPQVALLAEQPENNARPLTAFEAFWNAYPNKKAKPAARSAFERAVRRGSIAAVMAGVEAWRPDWARDRDRFCPWPQKFLNQDLWKPESWPTPRPVRTSGRAPGGVQQTVNLGRRIMAEMERDQRAIGGE